MMANVAVIGGQGFLGKETVVTLVNQGHNVKVLDAQECIVRHPKVVNQYCDIRDGESLKALLHGLDFVFNFAALSDLNQALWKPIQTLNVNVLGHLNIMEACRVGGVQRCIFASSVYAESKEGGFYSCSKRAAEDYTKEFQKRYGLGYTILRYGSVYGPGSDERNGLWRIVKRAIEKGELSYPGHPESVREYIHVRDAAQGSVAILDKKFENKTIMLNGLQPLAVAYALRNLRY